MIWSVFLVMTALAVLSVLWPLLRGRRGTDPAAGRRDVYDAELASIERDVARGLTSEAEANASRAEAARRLLAASKAAAPTPSGSTMARRIAALAALIFIPAVSFGLYTIIGAAGYPDQPLQARLNGPVDGGDINVALARIEKHLEEAPDDARGWEIIAPVYLKLGRASDSARAWQKVISIAGVNAERASSFGEALVYAEDGQVSPQARAAFEAALNSDASEPRAQFFLGMADEQAGDNQGAIARWTRLLESSPADAPFAPAVRERIAEIGGRPTGPASGPLSAAGAAVAAMPADDQQKFMRERIAALADRLAHNGADPQGWQQLVRSYAVLGEKDKARSALDDARKALSGDAASLSQLDALSGQFGLGG